MLPEHNLRLSKFYDRGRHKFIVHTGRMWPINVPDSRRTRGAGAGRCAAGRGLRREPRDRVLFAAHEGDLATLEMLIAHAEDPKAAANAADYDKRTPLHLAAAEGREACVEFLLAAGADPHATDRFGNTALGEDAVRH